jgi:hypothetical protein
LRSWITIGGAGVPLVAPGIGVVSRLLDGLPLDALDELDEPEV